MPSIDRRVAARRKAWGRGPMILRFQTAPPEPAAPLRPEPSATGPAEPQPASMILGLRLLREIGALDELVTPASAEQVADIDQPSQPSPAPRTRRIIVHPPHTPSPTPHLRVFAPTDTRATSESRVPVTRS